MVTRIRLLSQSLASADTVARLTGYKYQPADVAGVLVDASGLVEAIAGWGRAARYGTYMVSEAAPLGSVWTLPLYPVLSVDSFKIDGEQIVDYSLQNGCQIGYKYLDVERLHSTPPQLEATVFAGYWEDEAPLPVLIAVAVAVDMILSQTTVGPRQLDVPGLSVKLPTIVQAIQEALGAA